MRVSEPHSRFKTANGDVSGRHRRTAWSLPLFASFVTGAFIAVIVASPAQAETVTVGLDDYLHKIGVVKGLGALLKRGVVKLPGGGPGLP